MPEVSVASSAFKSRSIAALRAAVIHLLFSATIASAFAALIFGIWFTAPLRELVGGTKLFLLIVGVDVVCGPLLTLVVFNPIKPRAELKRDLVLITIIQFLALGYGIHSLAHAHPVALVYEVDRFRVITYSDIDKDEETSVPDWAKPWTFAFPRTVGLQFTDNSYEAKMESINASLQGVEPSQRPSRWQDYALSVSQVLQRARPLAELISKHPTQNELIGTAIASTLDNAEPGETIDPLALYWLPLVSRRANDWVALLDPKTARVRGYIHLDGF